VTITTISDGQSGHSNQLIQRCPICSQPVDSPYKDADVYHMECLMRATRHLRKDEEMRP